MWTQNNKSRYRAKFNYVGNKFHAKLILLLLYEGSLYQDSRHLNFINKQGDTIDFMLSGLRNEAAAMVFFK